MYLTHATLMQAQCTPKSHAATVDRPVPARRRLVLVQVCGAGVRDSDVLHTHVLHHIRPRSALNDLDGARRTGPRKHHVCDSNTCTRSCQSHSCHHTIHMGLLSSQHCH